ncbi:integrase [Steroidobacter denitrificans]|uniref:Integrase n=1 Tax=Steroidobacter denitrificans TaxID=465721 RepID=A0A127F8U9_STEDE|nr:integrase arm-type DNA-binding domain-containing protein [Steroidobacter denitrificans]AMN46061.1 integrase [Steroidobacter denitrificans]
MLTDTQVRGAKPSDRPQKLTDGRGLYLLVTPGGGRYWRYDYSFHGKRRTLALGVYPDVPLVRARERHHEARRLLAEGVDPAAAKQAVSQDFEAVARAWHDHWKAGRTEHYAQSVKTRLETDIFPQIGHRPIAGLSPADFRDAVRKIEKRGAFEIARRLLQNCGQIMRYAVANDLALRNPVAEVRPADILIPRKRRNHPRVTAKELPDLLHAIDSYVGGEHTRLALQLMALTFVRTSELIGTRWPEFDFKASQWDIPAERMKMKTPHVVALSTQSQAILKRLKEISFDRELVFPGDINPSKPMSTNTLLFALYRMGYRGRMTGHGFRGVASTILHEQGWPHEHIELQLAHQERNEVSAAYNHALYLEPRAKMMQAWADHLDRLRLQGVGEGQKAA